MCAPLILALARVMRCAIVVSGTRNAAAISATVSPPSSRRVSATRASGASAGWQQVKSSRRRSSSTAPVGSCGVSSWIIRAAWCLASRCCSRRIRSIARRTAVVVSQPPGLGGTPSTGQRSRAARSASPAASSATSRSPKRRVSEATTRPNSSRKIRSTSPLILRQSFALERPHLDLATAGGRTLLRPLQRLVEVGGLDHPEAAEVLLRLGVRPVAHDRGVARVVHGRGLLDRRQAPREHPGARVADLLVEAVDGLEDRLHLLQGRELRVVVVVHRQQVLGHVVLLGFGRPYRPPDTPSTNGSAGIRQPRRKIFPQNPHDSTDPSMRCRYARSGALPTSSSASRYAAAASASLPSSRRSSARAAG